ncbi:perlucin-like [Malaya genurostris]|uniref:perlucin-like n=1 Tax=Malaya genurostris TaxID=325434 RepID=UPI0026F3BB9A|nr:perlucin-like [Malaya genurostris]
MTQKVILVVLLSVSLCCLAQHLKCVSEAKYFIPNFMGNWFKATEYCNYLGMRLAVISTSEEQTNLTTMIAATDKFSNDTTNIWIGGSDLAEEVNFYWLSTGKRVGYSNWRKNQPDNDQNTDHCMEIRYNPVQGWNWHWNDQDCKAIRYFVCENLHIGKKVVLF